MKQEMKLEFESIPSNEAFARVVVAAFLTRLIGFLILLYAVLDVISTITIKSTVKKIKTAINEGIEEAKVIEVKEKQLEDKKEKNKKKERKNDDE